MSTATSKPLICRGCWEQMRVPVPIRGPLAVPLRLFGIKRSNMNPDICTICELMFETVMRRRNVAPACAWLVNRLTFNLT